MKIRTHDVNVFDLIVLPRYKNWHTNNTRHNIWDSSGIFYPFNVGFCELARQKQKQKTRISLRASFYVLAKSTYYLGKCH